MRHHGEVVRDEQVGHALFPLQVLQQIQNLRLHRDIQRADRFIADNQPRA